MFQFGGLGALFGGTKPTKAPPWRRDWLCKLMETIYKQQHKRSLPLTENKAW